MKNNIFSNMFLKYVIKNSPTLMEFGKSLVDQKSEQDYSFGLDNKELYSRLLSGFDFSKLPESEKDNFLFSNSKSLGSASKDVKYENLMPLLIQEAHNRTCYSLGVKPTTVEFTEFTEDKGLDSEDWIDFGEKNAKIYLNSNKRYDITRPSMLLENINMATRQYGIYANIFKAVNRPESLDNKEFFLALSTAVKVFVYDKLEQNDPQFLSQLMAVDYTTPIEIEKTIFSFEKTRSDFQSANLYGGALRDKLRQDEEIYHEYLSDEGVVDSLLNLEDVFQSFKAFMVVAKVDNSFGKIFEAIENEYFSDYYSTLGADTEKGQGIRAYIDYLEEEMFDRVGITMEEYLNYKNSTQREVDEYGEDEVISERYIDEGYGDDEEATCYNGVTGEEFDSDDFGAGEDEDNITYKPMENVIKPEGEIIDGVKLPFVNAVQDGGMSL